jgi:hypothetical protein
MTDVVPVLRQEGRRRRLRVVLALALAVFTSAIVTGSAPAYHGYELTQWYHGPGGFDNLSSNYPTECLPGWGNGCAHTGFNNWDWSGIAKVNGGCIAIGFRNSSGGFYPSAFCSEMNGTEFHITRAAVGAPTYNRVSCMWWSGDSSYVRCWAKLFA